MINSKSFISISLITLLNFIIINYSVSFLDYKLPDSSSYLNYSPKYKSFYPFLINFVEILNLNLIYVQILFLSFSSRVRVVLGLLPTAIVSDPTHIKFYRKKDIIKIFSVFNIKLRFYSSSFSLNIFNPKSKFKIPTINFFSSLDDSLIFTIKKLS